MSHQKRPVTSDRSQPQTRKDRRAAERSRAAARVKRVRVTRRAHRHWLGLAGAAAVVVVIGWLIVQNQTIIGSTSDSEIPGPQGGSHISQDVNTLVGEPAPTFTLANADGKEFTVTPGRGQPTVLIFHMGIT